WVSRWMIRCGRPRRWRRRWSTTWGWTGCRWRSWRGGCARRGCWRRCPCARGRTTRGAFRCSRWRLRICGSR
ncbi:MAG: hypothetical protein AVDCRST_MAG89-3910, partial [uncultured Gemmatimonadetes bacterium]